RMLNARTKLSAVPLPRIDDIFDAIGAIKPKYFIALDMASGYHQIKMSPEAQKMSAIVCGPYHLEWTRMPYGLTNSPSFFMTYMSKTLAGLDPDRIFVFIDDVIIAAETVEKLIEVFGKVLARLRQKHLRLKPNKCTILCKEVTFLGLVLDHTGLHTDPKKVQAIKEYPPPTKVKEVRQFLGMAGYFRRFIPHFSGIAKPMTRLQEKDFKWDWSQECQTAFDELKDRLTTAPCLAYPDFSKPFYIECDASLTGLGAQLLQREGVDDQNALFKTTKEIGTPLLKQGDFHPIAFISKSFNKHERNYSASEKEALAVVYACGHFQHYIYDRPVYVITDCVALKYMLQSKDLSHQLARWALTIQALNPIILYRPGRVNEMADGLSRRPFSKFEQMAAENEPVENVIDNPIDDTPYVPISSNSPSEKILTIHFIEAVEVRDHFIPPDLTPPSEDLDVVRKEQEIDSFCSVFLNYLWYKILPDTEALVNMVLAEESKFILYRNVLWRDDSNFPEIRIVVPKASREILIREAHDLPFSGHVGPRRTYKKLAHKYYWPFMRQEVINYLACCLACAHRRGQHRTHKVPMAHVPIVYESMHTVA
ncbi:MAG: hypothetical protein GY738_14340, partial [Pseudoalteromonas sp.]|nr:hypothetical protein [Pseudoalteromonas sp.]